VWRNITSSSANSRARDDLQHEQRQRQLQADPHAGADLVANVAGAFGIGRPKSSANSDTERSQKMVSVSLSLPDLAVLTYSGLS
jgi:hypothetical protein